MRAKSFSYKSIFLICGLLGIFSAKEAMADAELYGRLKVPHRFPPGNTLPAGSYIVLTSDAGSTWLTDGLGHPPIPKADVELTRRLKYSPHLRGRLIRQSPIYTDPPNLLADRTTLDTPVSSSTLTNFAHCFQVGNEVFISGLEGGNYIILENGCANFRVPVASIELISRFADSGTVVTLPTSSARFSEQSSTPSLQTIIVGGGAAIVILFLILILSAYFFPTIIAYCRGHLSTVPIFVLNLLLGWSILIWFLILAWSFFGDTRSKKYPKPKYRFDIADR